MMDCSNYCNMIQVYVDDYKNRITKDVKDAVN